MLMQHIDALTTDVEIILRSTNLIYEDQLILRQSSKAIYESS